MGISLVLPVVGGVVGVVDGRVLALLDDNEELLEVTRDVEEEEEEREEEEREEEEREEEGEGVWILLEVWTTMDDDDTCTCDETTLSSDTCDNDEE